MGKKIVNDSEWDEIVSMLTSEGLNADYAQAIVDNLKEETEKSSYAKSKNRKLIVVALSVVWAIIAVFFIRPLSYMMSPEYGRYIFIGIVGIGLGIINQYRKGEEKYKKL